MNETRWKLTLVLDANTSRSQYPTLELAVNLEPTVNGPTRWDEWACSGMPFVAVGDIGQIEAWLSHIDGKDNITSKTLCIERDSIPASSYFGNGQRVAREELLKNNEDAPPLNLLSKLIDDEIIYSAVIAGCSLMCQYSQGTWRFKFDSTSHPKVAGLLQSSVSDELSLNEAPAKNDFQFELTLDRWVEPGRILNDLGSSRYYVDLRKTTRSPNSFGTDANTSCQRITEHPDYQEAIPPDTTLIDATLATLVTGSLLLLPAITLWLNPFKKRQSQHIPTDPPTIRKLIDYLLKPGFDSEAAILLLQALKLPINSSDYDGERFAISEDWEEDQRVAFQLIVPESRIESVFKLDHSRLDSRAVLV